MQDRHIHYRIWLGRFLREYLRIRAEVLEGNPQGTCQTESHEMRAFARGRRPGRVPNDMGVLIMAQPVGRQHLREWF